MKLSKNAKNAIVMCILCSVAYLAVYIARNMLSALTPQILEAGLLTKDFLGTLSSAYFFFYAVGQLINGIIGDRIKAVYMISIGLLLSGVTGFFFPLMISSGVWLVILYGMTGFFLSMIYAPMTRVVAESTEPIYAVRSSVGYTFASFFGSPIAGLCAAAFVWQTAMHVSNISLVVMAVICYVLFVVFERRGIVRYGVGKSDHSSVGAPERLRDKLSLLLRRDIVRYSAVSVLTGIVRTAVMFWMPTYFSDYLGYTSEQSAIIFTVASLVISANSFIAIWVYELLGRRQYPSLLILFGVSLAAFVLTFLVKVPVLNIIFLVIAITASSGASGILWSVYCPSLADTGMVSSATGYLDFLSYMAAAVATAVFGNMVDLVGWDNLVLIWTALSVLGVAISVPRGKRAFLKSDKPSV